ncbi:MAG: mycofactocin-coupled SDR family oxidoreductase [Actinomycetota bacterium]|nr:mycofactocin-coupled SDR family oxidoreductase [Actinomycetota bacterium]
MDQQPRVAVVTGAARGIGAAVVNHLAGDGWGVVAVDACADDPAVGYPLGTRAELAAVCAPYGHAVQPVVADVRHPAGLEQAVAVAEATFGGLDAAVAGAGIIAGGRDAWETDQQTWRVLLDVDVLGVANLVRAAVPALLRRPEPRSGRFVAIASVAGHQGLWRLSAYNAAKHAVVGLIKGLAMDLRGTGVTATAVSPGSTRTPMLEATAAIYDLQSVEEFAASQLTGSLLDPRQVAAAIGWLCSVDSAAITGSVLHADGGFTG